MNKRCNVVQSLSKIFRVSVGRMWSWYLGGATHSFLHTSWLQCILVVGFNINRALAQCGPFRDLQMKYFRSKHRKESNCFISKTNFWTRLASTNIKLLLIQLPWTTAKRELHLVIFRTDDTYNTSWQGKVSWAMNQKDSWKQGWINPISFLTPADNHQ